MAEPETSTETIACPNCPTGRLEKGITNLMFGERTREDALRAKPSPVIIVVVGVPAEVCDVCGESIVDSSTAKEVEELTREIRFWWDRDPSRLEVEGVVIGGEPGGDEGIVRVDFETNELPHDRVSVRGG